MLFEMRWIKSGGTMFCEVALSSLRRVLAYESPLKIMKNAFYFILKALFVLEIFKGYLRYKAILCHKTALDV